MRIKAFVLMEIETPPSPTEESARRWARDYLSGVYFGHQIRSITAVAVGNTGQALMPDIFGRATANAMVCEDWQAGIPRADGPFLVCCDVGPESPPVITKAYFVIRNSRGEWDMLPPGWDKKITHWMPLPPLPKLENKKS